MARNGIVSAKEIRRRIAAAGGDIRDTDIKTSPGGSSLSFIPTRRAGHSVTRKELVSEYVRYLTELHDLRGDLMTIPREGRAQFILAEAEKAAAQHFRRTQ